MTAAGTAALAPLLAGEADVARLRARGDDAAAAREAAKALEVTLFAQLLAAMRATVRENDFLPASPARKTYEGVFDRAVAETLAERDPLGLAARLAPPPEEQP